MSRLEPSSHTFLLRIWIEETREESGRLSWRGQVSHLPDEDRRYVESFEEIARFIRRHVRGVGMVGFETFERQATRNGPAERGGDG